ncbi:hypothetical protein [Halorubrum sodomense]|uniref:Uncharacterized protein n=1 Tax=Halorubrum sodomense TaxID=35743 RepID=A0A1I6FMK0_HALSD|nr:hypothetical protein [Halorubrum sodomense]SFR31160.1 hypothetical protein SAMN04487937_1001 [Halorubrum sodomense]
MSWLLEALAALGAGQQVLMGATLLVVGFYLFKAVKIGKVVGDLFSSAAGYAIVVAVGAGLAIALGWVDPNVGAATSQLATAVDAVWSVVGEWVIEQTIGRLG